MAGRSPSLPEDDGADQLTAVEVETLATVFATPDAASGLLYRAGLPLERFPAFVPGVHANGFWAAVSRDLGYGRAPGGRRRLLAVAAAEYPGNPTLRRDCATTHGMRLHFGMPQDRPAVDAPYRSFSGGALARRVGLRAGLRRGRAGRSGCGWSGSDGPGCG
ncbi:effector-associated domain EAD1-containing protein [Frankia sp. AiPa1]|uniref:effector-associated domain EAD1-containing protein n=1 Tax=Frankia sp. AiPa1 TaxID=573492 RepID=UPI0035A90D9D